MQSKGDENILAVLMPVWKIRAPIEVLEITFIEKRDIVTICVLVDWLFIVAICVLANGNGLYLLWHIGSISSLQSYIKVMRMPKYDTLISHCRNLRLADCLHCHHLRLANEILILRLRDAVVDNDYFTG